MSKGQGQSRPTKDLNSGSPTRGEPEFVAVGKLHRPHGVRGEMRMSIWTEFPERLQPQKLVYVGKTYESFHIKKLRGEGKDSLISFTEFDNREDAGKLRNQVVFVRTTDLPSLPDDGLYLHQLLGLQVISDDDDTLLGTVAEIIETGANDVFLVRREGERDILIPDIDTVVLNINLTERKIRVHLLPGLVPDNR